MYSRAQAERYTLLANSLFYVTIKQALAFLLVTLITDMRSLKCGKSYGGILAVYQATISFSYFYDARDIMHKLRLGQAHKHTLALSLALSLSHPHSSFNCLVPTWSKAHSRYSWFHPWSAISSLLLPPPGTHLPLAAFFLQKVSLARRARRAQMLWEGSLISPILPSGMPITVGSLFKTWLCWIEWTIKSKEG